MSEDIDIGEISEALNDKMDRDAGNPATLGKERIVGWGMPDWTKATNDTSASITLEKDSIVFFAAQVASYTGGHLLINGTTDVEITTNQTGSAVNCAGALIASAGDTIAYSTGFTGNNRHFQIVPLKGA